MTSTNANVSVGGTTRQQPMPDTPKPKRNTHAIGFNDDEYALIVEKAKNVGLYPRQYLMMRIRADK